MDFNYYNSTNRSNQVQNIFSISLAHCGDVWHNFLYFWCGSCACDNNDICIDVNSTESNEISMELDDDDGEDVNDVITTNCSELCTHGSCVDTDTCLCNDGYQPSHVDKFDCEPICGEADIESIGCINGICIAPQTCECLDGFVLNGNVHPFTCTPVDGDDGHDGQVLSNVFWILMGSAVIFIGLTIAVLIVWTRRERKTIYVADGNGMKCISIAMRPLLN